MFEFLQETRFGQIALLVLLVLTTYSFISTYLEHQQLHFIHEAAVGIILGLIIGVIYTFILQQQNVQVNFSKEFFFYILLPIIIFKEGYSMNKHQFFKNFFYVVLYGILATILYFIIVAALTYLTRELGNPLYRYSLKVGLRLAAALINNKFKKKWIYIISFSTLLVSLQKIVLSLYRYSHLKKNPNFIALYSENVNLSLQFNYNEEILNDLIVFSIQRGVQTLKSSPSQIFDKWYFFFELIGFFLMQLAVSILVGFIFGALATWLMKKGRFMVKHSSISTAFTVYCGYIAFTFCEVFEFSGVAAVLICGALMQHYLTYNLSKAATKSSRVTVKACAYVCESFIYIYLGFAVFQYSDKDACVSFTFIAIQVIVIKPIARFLSLIMSHGLAIAFRLKTKKKWRINKYEFFILFYSGLIKGSVAYALIQSETVIYPSSVQITESTVLAEVILTTIFIGGSLTYVTEWTFKKMHEDKAYRASLLGSENEETEKEKYKNLAPKSQTRFKYFDENFLKPFFIYRYIERKEFIALAKKELAEKEEQMRLREEQLFDDSIRVRHMLKEQFKPEISAPVESNLTMNLDSKSLSKGEFAPVHEMGSLDLKEKHK